jgi:hypothetical protein
MGFSVDLGSGLRWAGPTVSCLGRVTDVFQLKIHWTEGLSCFFGSEVVPLFSVVLYVVRAMHKFDFRLVTKETSYKR